MSYCVDDARFLAMALGKVVSQSCSVTGSKSSSDLHLFVEP
jgi:hypothetical protein